MPIRSQDAEEQIALKNQYAMAQAATVAAKTLSLRYWAFFIGFAVVDNFSFDARVFSASLARQLLELVEYCR
jgi:hypothetical protein